MSSAAQSQYPAYNEQWSTYVNNTNDDGHLHLQRVREHQTVISIMPGGIQTKRIDVTIVDSNDRIVALLCGPIPSRMKDVERLGEYIVVYEAGVYGEEPHEKNDVSSAVR